MPQDEIDAYVLISHGSGGDTEDIGSGSGGGRWHGRGVGAFDAVVALTASGLPDLHEQVRGIKANRGPIRLDTLVAVRSTPMKVKRTLPLAPGEVMAFTLIDARAGQTRAVFDEIARPDRGVAAACIVTGSADILVELHAPDLDGLVSQAEALGSIDGVRSTTTTFVQSDSDGQQAGLT